MGVSRYVYLLLPLLASCATTGQLEDNPEVQQAMAHFNKFYNTVSTVAAIRRSKDKGRLYDYTCEASKKRVTAKKLHRQFSRLDKMAGITGFYPPKRLEALKRSGAKNVIEFRKLDTVGVNFDLPSEHHVNGRIIKGSSGQGWQFYFENNRWCINFRDF